MASKQLKQMNEIYASIKERLANPDIDLATLRAIAENVHLAAAEPEAVTYEWRYRRESVVAWPIRAYDLYRPQNSSISQSRAQSMMLLLDKIELQWPGTPVIPSK